jgi:hypothetical protein
MPHQRKVLEVGQYHQYRNDPACTAWPSNDTLQQRLQTPNIALPRPQSRNRSYRNARDHSSTHPPRGDILPRRGHRYSRPLRQSPSPATPENTDEERLKRFQNNDRKKESPQRNEADRTDYRGFAEV